MVFHKNSKVSIFPNEAENQTLFHNVFIHLKSIGKQKIYGTKAAVSAVSRH